MDGKTKTFAKKMTNRVITLLIFAFLLGCKSESVSTKSTETAASMKEAFVKLIEAESPTNEIQIIEAKVVGELGVIFADLHPGSGRKPATVYMPSMMVAGHMSREWTYGATIHDTCSQEYISPRIFTVMLTRSTHGFLRKLVEMSRVCG